MSPNYRSPYCYLPCYPTRSCVNLTCPLLRLRCARTYSSPSFDCLSAALSCCYKNYSSLRHHYKPSIDRFSFPLSTLPENQQPTTDLQYPESNRTSQRDSDFSNPQSWNRQPTIDSINPYSNRTSQRYSDFSKPQTGSQTPATYSQDPYSNRTSQRYSDISKPQTGSQTPATYSQDPYSNRTSQRYSDISKAQTGGQTPATYSQDPYSNRTSQRYSDFSKPQTGGQTPATYSQDPYSNRTSQRYSDISKPQSQNQPFSSDSKNRKSDLSSKKDSEAAPEINVMQPTPMASRAASNMPSRNTSFRLPSTTESEPEERKSDAAPRVGSYFSTEPSEFSAGMQDTGVQVQPETTETSEDPCTFTSDCESNIHPCAQVGSYGGCSEIGSYGSGVRDRYYGIRPYSCLQPSLSFDSRYSSMGTSRYQDVIRPLRQCTFSSYSFHRGPC